MDNRVVLDSDFCNMIAPGNDKEKDKKFVKSIFESLDNKPILHPFVCKEELLSNIAIQELVNEGFIEVVGYDSFLKEDIFKTQYVDTFADFYTFINGESIERNFDVITKHRAKRNMGEIHSLILAHYLSIPVFMSNDNGAKNLAASKINTQAQCIVVKNVCEVFCDIKRFGAFQIDAKAVRAILKQREGWSEFYKTKTESRL